MWPFPSFKCLEKRGGQVWETKVCATNFSTSSQVIPATVSDWGMSADCESCHAACRRGIAIPPASKVGLGRNDASLGSSGSENCAQRYFGGSLIVCFAFASAL
jgi:hypothetical protein